ncbi:hypothetical protein ACIP5Y_07475 [Nocardia sp. NPDC088792]|uniref:hypothetical protein n=1 Tax=Nocardia sp. NPDC088792 TaxID=3364332 RepID=UPI0037F68BDC
MPPTIDPTGWQTPADEIEVDAVLLTRRLPCGGGQIEIEIGTPHRVDRLLGTELTEWTHPNLTYVCRYRIRGHHGEGSAHSGYVGGCDAFDALAAAMMISNSMALVRTDVEGDYRVASEASIVTLEYTVSAEHRGSQ